MRKAPVLLPFLISGSLMAVAFIYPLAWWLAFCGLAWLLYLIRSAISDRRAVFYSWLAIAVKYLTAIYFFWSLRTEALFPGIDLTLANLAIFAVWLLVGLLMALPFAFFVLFYKKFTNIFLTLIVAPALLVLSEISGSFIYSIFSLENLTSLNIKFSFGYLGYVLAQHNLIGQVATIGGVYLMTATLFYLAFVICYLFRLGKYLYIGLLLLVLIATAQINLGVAPLGYKVFTLQTQIFSAVKSNQDMVAIKHNMQSAVATGLQEAVDYVLVPESINIFSEQATATATAQFLADNSPQPVTMLVTGDTEDETGADYVYAAFVDRESQVARVYKNYLSPFGETAPALLDLVSNSFHLENLNSSLKDRQTYQPYAKAQNLPPNLPTVLFCIEAVDPLALYRQGNPDAPFVAHLASQGWFNPSIGLRNQMDMMLKTQARFSRKPIIQASNYGAVKSYDARGGELKGEVVYRSPGVLGIVYEF